MSRFIILSPSFDPDDATGVDALGMEAVLRVRNLDTERFGIEESRSSGSLKSLEKKIQEGSIPLYQFSTSWTEILPVLEGSSAPVVIRYHNITPPEYFRGYSPLFEKLQMRAAEERRRLGALKKALILADSTFNARDFPSPEQTVKLLPPFHRLDDFRRIEPDWKTLEELGDLSAGKAPVLLNVGRIVPNKGHLRLLECFDWIRKEYPGAILIVVGGFPPLLKSYRRELKKELRRRRLEKSVFFPGGVSRSVLRSLYLGSTALLMTSHHEGFGVPVMEAMYHSLPVIAMEAGALRETCGDASILVPDGSCEEFVKVVRKLLESREDRNRIIEDQKDHFQNKYRREVLEHRFLEILEEGGFL